MERTAGSPKVTRRHISAVAVFLVALTGCDEPAAPEAQVRPVNSIVVGAVERFRKGTFPGRAKATQEINVAFEVSGKLQKRHVDVGDRVKAGDVLAVIEPDRFEADIKRIKAEIVAARARVTNTAKQLSRQETLLAKGHVSAARVDNFRSAARQARAQSTALEAALERAELFLSYTIVFAPFNGTVAATYAEDFQNIVAKQPILRLLDTSQIEMEVNIPEGLIGLASYVSEIKVRFKALPDVEFTARVKEISNEASITTRTYPVTIIMDRPADAEINPGMAGEATAVLELPDSWQQRGVEVPASALFSPGNAEPDEVFVWIVDPATRSVSRRQVLMIRANDRGAIIQGVEAGDRIVTAGVSYLTDGQTVRILAD